MGMCNVLETFRPLVVLAKIKPCPPSLLLFVAFICSVQFFFFFFLLKKTSYLLRSMGLDVKPFFFFLV